MRKLILAASVAALALMPSMASAAIFIGTTVGGPTWTRPVAGNPPVPPQSAVGVGVSYSATAFTVTAAGNYTFQSTATSPANWDNYTFLYQNSFDAASPFSNVLIGNDDNPSIGLSGFNYSLLTGVNYFLITTGFGTNDAGTYSLSITGPGDVLGGSMSAIPEPATWGMMLVGLGTVGAAMRGRRRVKVSFA